MSRHPVTAATLLALVLASAVGASCGEGRGEVDPVEVTPGDAPDGAAPTADGGQASSHPGGAIWVEDADGQPVGVLVRRGTDESVASRAIYDFVTVFHPGSGLFFELTMSDGAVRYPHTTIFEDFNCGTPIGVLAGACTECRAGFGVGLLHDGRWWRLRGGAPHERMGPGSSRDAGLEGGCVAHGTSNARAFPLEQVPGAAPPTDFEPPLRFTWR